mmetsp:Transcript_1815/g.2579  ORF Transcript_1815/g.2579 Transcript_1815/m.2579 type:complete len:86 (+) Transcript_1815:104-361(+)
MPRCKFINPSMSRGVLLLSFFDERYEQFFFADFAIRVLVHLSEGLQELGLVERLIRHNFIEHLATELAHFVLLEPPVLIRVNACK